MLQRRLVRNPRFGQGQRFRLEINRGREARRLDCPTPDHQVVHDHCEGNQEQQVDHTANVSDQEPEQPENDQDHDNSPKNADHDDSYSIEIVAFG